MQNDKRTYLRGIKMSDEIDRKIKIASWVILGMGAVFYLVLFPIIILR